MCLALANFVTVDAAQERFRLREPQQWAIIEPLSSTERTRLLRDPMQHSTEKVFVGWRRGAVKALRAANSASPHPKPRALSAQASEMSDRLRETDKLGKSRDCGWWSQTELNRRPLQCHCRGPAFLTTSPHRLSLPNPLEISAFWLILHFQPFLVLTFRWRFGGDLDTSSPQ